MVSIIITYYRKKSFIKKTLKSIYDQSYKNYELIFVYDDKNKKELEYIKPLMVKFKKKKIIINKKNFGVAKSRNIALRYARGKYIAFIDSDDLWRKNKLLYQIKYMREKNLLFTFTSYGIIDEKNQFLGLRKVSKDTEYSNLLKSNVIGLSTVILDRKILKHLSFPILKTQEDYGLWLKLARKGIKLSHLNLNLSFWRKTKNSLSSNSLNKIVDAYKLYRFYEKKNFIIAIYSVITLAYNKLYKIIFNS